MGADPRISSPPPVGMEDYPGRASATEMNGGAESPTPASDALRTARQQVQELIDFVSYYVTARLDAAKVTARNVVLYAALGVIGLVAAFTLVATSVVLVCLGLAYAVAALVGYAWVGMLIVGILILGAIGGGVYFGFAWFTRQQRNRTVNRYEQKQRRQRETYGHDVEQRAQNA
jgi:hypothetical protein